MANRCSIPGCRGDTDLVYLDHGICVRCWNQLTAEDEPADALARALGISVAEATTVEDPTMAEKTETTKKGTKKTAKAAKAPKPKKERPPKEDLVVFACRVAEVERVKFHDATGPAGASRFARKLLVVFANEDEPGFRALLKEARELRA